MLKQQIMKTTKIELKEVKSSSNDYIFLNVSFDEYLKKCKELGFNHYCKDHLEVNCKVCKEKLVECK